MKLSLAKVGEWISAGGNYDPAKVVKGYSIDSRTIRPQDLFFAVKGERLDGHDYVEAALRAGASAAVVRSDQLQRYPAGAPLLAAHDTLVALQRLSMAVRRAWGKPLIGITGSAGKTTTKEAIAHLLATRYRVLKSEGNFNNHFGLPLMLLKLETEHDVAVIEMGMSHLGEIQALAAIAQPETGVVTCVAPVHLEFFDSVASIARAKYELIESLPSNGTAVLNADDEYVSQFGVRFPGKVVKFGIERPAEVRAENIEERGAEGSRFEVVVENQRQRAMLPLVGRHNIYNALAAVAVAVDRGLTPEEAAKGLASLRPADKRGEVIQVGDTRVINDCYNSNPKALEAMVDAVAVMTAQRRIVVAGEMLELGPAGEELHRKAGRHIAERGIDVLIGVRGLAKAMVEEAASRGIPAQFMVRPEDAGEWLARETGKGDVVLLKASRGVKLEQALDTWKERRAKAAGGN
jgi:UDP-N-acetylmuramoyl-tripeptide--D-alanyl-D-alanine ligase